MLYLMKRNRRVSHKWHGGAIMQFQMEIQRAVRHQSYLDDGERKTVEELNKIVETVINNVQKNNYDFSRFSSIVIKQQGKKRYAKQYIDCYSTESILCQYIKQIIDQKFKIRYANRNKLMRSLFDILPAVKDMMDFTIAKIDFKDFFNSISAPYVFDLLFRQKDFDRNDLNIVEKYVNETQYAYAGLCTSNALAEIIANEFDQAVKMSFYGHGLIFYKRYVDDCLLIFNENIDQKELDDKLAECLQKTFYNNSIRTSIKCKTKFNAQKRKIITRRSINNGTDSFDFLGYSFYFEKDQKKRIIIKYGISIEKQKKYIDRIDKLISCYLDSQKPDYQDLELLRHRILAFTCRTVYLRKQNNTTVWKVKGFISNYGELRFMLNAGLVEANTLAFLQNMVEEAFIRANIQKPYFIRGDNAEHGGYNLLGNMKSNKTLLFVDRIGYDYNSLAKLCKKIGIENEAKGKKLTYSELARRYLIKVKVGY